MKLTTPQRLLLRHVYQGKMRTVSATYKTALRMQKLGLVTLKEMRLGNSTITLTEAGTAEAMRRFGDLHEAS